MILLDVDMPGMNGYEAITILKADINYADIPVIFVTAKTSEADEFAGLDLGAVDYITKPFTPPLLLKRMENHLFIQKQKKFLQNNNNNLVKMAIADGSGTHFDPVLVNIFNKVKDDFTVIAAENLD